MIPRIIFNQADIWDTDLDLFYGNSVCTQILKHSSVSEVQIVLNVHAKLTI